MTMLDESDKAIVESLLSRMTGIAKEIMTAVSNLSQHVGKKISQPSRFGDVHGLVSRLISNWTIAALHPWLGEALSSLLCAPRRCKLGADDDARGLMLHAHLPDEIRY